MQTLASALHSIPGGNGSVLRTVPYDSCQTAKHKQRTFSATSTPNRGPPGCHLSTHWLSYCIHPINTLVICSILIDGVPYQAKRGCVLWRKNLRFFRICYNPYRFEVWCGVIKMLYLLPNCYSAITDINSTFSTALPPVTVRNDSFRQQRC